MLVKRAVALFIDSFLVGIVPNILSTVMENQWIGIVLSIVLGVIYQWYFLTRNEGQTLGKRFLGIRVVTMDGGPISDVAAVIRYFGYLLNGIFFIGWIVAVITGRGFHDRLAGTQVVDA